MKYALTAERIKEAMNDMHMTQQELADKSQIGKSSISHYVNGSNEPGNKSAYALAQVLKVNPAWLMGLDAPKHASETVKASFVKYLSGGEKISIDLTDDNARAELEHIFNLYESYQGAIPQVREAVEALLKPSRSVS